MSDEPDLLKQRDELVIALHAVLAQVDGIWCSRRLLSHDEVAVLDQAHDLLLRYGIKIENRYRDAISGP